jgi:hypothetical protein
LAAHESNVVIIRQEFLSSVKLDQGVGILALALPDLRQAKMWAC